MRFFGLAVMLFAVSIGASAMAQQKSKRVDLGDELNKWLLDDGKSDKTSTGADPQKDKSGGGFTGLINNLLGGKKEGTVPTTLEGRARADNANLLEVTKSDGSVVRVRQWGLEAPDTNQWPWGPRARGELDRLLAANGGKVSCSSDGTMTTSGNLVARCYAGQTDLSGKLIEGGFGVEWREVSGGAYTALEAGARSQKRGVWSGQ